MSGTRHPTKFMIEPLLFIANLENIKLQIKRLICSPEERMVWRLGTIFNLSEPFLGVLGRKDDGLRKKLF